MWSEHTVLHAAAYELMTIALTPRTDADEEPPAPSPASSWSSWVLLRGHTQSQMRHTAQIESLVLSGGLPQMVRSMWAMRHVAAVQAWGCAVLALVAAGPVAGLEAITHGSWAPRVQHAGGLATALEAASRHSDDVHVQIQACAVLLAFALDEHVRGREAVLRSGGLTVVRTAMSTHEHSVEMQAMGCRLLGAMGGPSELDLAVGAMVQHPASVAVATAACEVTPCTRPIVCRVPLWLDCCEPVDCGCIAGHGDGHGAVLLTHPLYRRPWRRPPTVGGSRRSSWRRRRLCY